MTAYQRGNRDGLMGLAKQLEVVIREEEAMLRHHQKEAERVIDPVVASALRRLIGHAWHRLQTAQQCHHLALAAAEALPDDPEVPNVE